MSATVIDRAKLFTALRVDADSERVVSILKRQQDEAATTATLAEIRRLKREAEFRRAYIDLLHMAAKNIVASEVDRQLKHGLRRPSDSEAAS